jgi:hypothetical protein
MIIRGNIMLIKTLAAASLAGLSLTGMAAAQDLSAEPTFGSLLMDATLGSQRTTTRVMSGGPVSASDLGDDCAGHISEAPTTRVDYSGGGARLRLVASSQSDVSLVVRSPEGEWLCNDDAPYGDFDPFLEIEAPVAGHYDVWVGAVGWAWSTGDPTPTELYVINLQEGERDARAASSFTHFELEPGFPDEDFYAIIDADGALARSTLGRGCRGETDIQPNMSVNYGSGGEFLTIQADSATDLILAVRTPDGDLECHDPLYPNVFVTLQNPESGRYDIWIGQTVLSPELTVPVTVRLLDDVNR